MAMTSAEIIQAIKAEIDKRYAYYSEKMKTDDFIYYEGMADSLDLFEQFLDTLELEKLVPKDLEEAADKYAEKLTSEPYLQIVHKTDFIAGAEWDREQMMNGTVDGEVDFEYFGYKVIRPDLKQLDTLLESMNHGDKVRIIIVKEDEK